MSAKATNLVELDTTECSRCVVGGARWTRIRRFSDSCCAQPIPAAAPGTQTAGDRLASFRVELAASIRLDIMSERLTPRAKSGETHVNVLAFFWRLASDSQIASLGLETRQLGPKSKDHFGRNLHVHLLRIVECALGCLGTPTSGWHVDCALASARRTSQIPQTFRQIVPLENQVFLELSFSVLGFAICFLHRLDGLQTQIEMFANWAEPGLTACLFQCNLEWCCIRECPRPTTATPLSAR